MKITYNAIGTILTPFKKIEDMPIQPSGAKGVKGQVEVFQSYNEALKDLDGFSHIYLIYHFHQVNSWQPLVTPFLDDESHGLFATRAPKRPNPIGLSIVRLLTVVDGLLNVENIDVLDGTPLLDIKPYVPNFDHFDVNAIGWLQKRGTDVKHQRSDDRFE